VQPRLIVVFDSIKPMVAGSFGRRKPTARVHYTPHPGPDNRIYKEPERRLERVERLAKQLRHE
jgi:hypothetical protein